VDKKTGKDFFGRDARGGGSPKAKEAKKKSKKHKKSKSRRKRDYSSEDSDAEDEADRSKKVRARVGLTRSLGYRASSVSDLPCFSVYSELKLVCSIGWWWWWWWWRGGGRPVSLCVCV
jgi:hypothetical protein